MDVLHQTQKTNKFLDEVVKPSELKETSDRNNENLGEKVKQNSSTTSRNDYLQSDLQMNYLNAMNSNTNNEENEKNYKFNDNNKKEPQQHSHNKASTNITYEENGKNNGKNEEIARKQMLLDMPFINYSKKRKTSLNYIRVRKIDVLPRNDIYEATDDDLEFINNFNKQNNDMNLLTMEVFEQLIVLWENNSEKDYPIAFQQARSLTTDKLDKNLFNKIEDVFNYWCQKRTELKRSLLRKMIRPNLEDTNTQLAFRPREKERMKLRRLSKANDLENLNKFKNLRHDLNFSKNLIEKVRIRETLKEDLIELSILKFKQEVQELTEGTNLNPLWKQLQDKINKDQCDSKKLPSKTSIYSPPIETIQQKIIKPKQKPAPIIMPVDNIETKNYDMACFISSILIEGENNGYLFDDITNPSMMPKKEEMPEKVIPKIEPLDIKPFVNPPIIKSDLINVPLSTNKLPAVKKSSLPFKIRKRVSRCNRMLIDRYLPDTDEESNFSQFYADHNKTYFKNEILKEKMNKFAKICVFSDSEDETNESIKNLKKNILINFKNFQKQNRGQMQLVKP